MRTSLLRVHTLMRYALFFLGAAFFLPAAAAQALCADLPNTPPAEGRWQLLAPDAQGDVLGYVAANGGSSCALPLQGRALAAPQVLPGADLAVVATRDGRVMGLPMRGRPWPVATVRLDGRITALAVSAPGPAGVVAVATQWPQELHMFDAALQGLQRLRLIDKAAQQSSPICALLVSPQRQSFVAVFSDMTELWELSYNPLAPEIGLGMVHDFQYREGHFVPGYLQALRTELPWNVATVGLDEDGHMLQLQGGSGHALVIHLDVRKPVAESARLGAPPQSCQRD